MAMTQIELAKKDQHWPEVLNLAKKYGFICSSHNGVITMASHRTQLEKYGEHQYANIQGQIIAEVLEK